MIEGKNILNRTKGEVAIEDVKVKKKDTSVKFETGQFAKNQKKLSGIVKKAKKGQF